MRLGYNQPLYLLPFDHRHSYEPGMFDFAPPLTPAQREAVADSKRLIYEGFQASLDEVPVARAGILVDEEFGVDILRDAAARGYVIAPATEQSGWDEFELEVAASVSRFIGFAVGRTTFWDAVGAYRAGATTRREAAEQIARRYAEWAEIFERAQP